MSTKNEVKVIDVTIRVTCLEGDANTVKEDMRRWFCENETPLVQRPRIGGISMGKPQNIQPWMIETLCPEII